MKTAVMYGKEDIRIEERPKPAVGCGQILVKIEYAGICGTDVEFFTLGQAPTPFPKILGHENAGVVCEVGEGVTDYKVGDRVLCGPPSHCIEDCPSCQEGRTNICINGFPRTAGIGMPDGGYAEYFLVQDAAHTMIVKVPEGVSMEDAVLFDIVCVSLHGVRQSNFKIGDDVVVSGMGPAGLSAVKFLKAGGARRIIALDVDNAKKEGALEYGADYFINSRECEDVAGEIRKILGSSVGADVVFECAGQPKSLETCVMQAVKPGGQVMMIGTVQENISMIMGNAQIFEPDLKFSFVYIQKEVEMYLDMLSTGKIAFPGMVTDIISLDDCVSKGLGRPDRNEQRKILIDPFKLSDERR